MFNDSMNTKTDNSQIIHNIIIGDTIRDDLINKRPFELLNYIQYFFADVEYVIF